MTREVSVSRAETLLPESERRQGWRVLRASGPAFFVTHAQLRRPDGKEFEWTSRRHRKGLGLIPSGARRRAHIFRRFPRGASMMSWWIGALFMVGSLCFALGSLPLYFGHVDPDVVGWTFFVGSIFFTTAAYLQFKEVVSAPEGVSAGASKPRRLRAYVGWTPHRIDWWATAVQLLGTVFFNVMTFSATRSDLSLEQEKLLIWSPDMLGSACFLIASWLAYSEVNDRVLPRSDGSVGWKISALNIGGSLAFGAAAVGSRYLTTTGEPADITLVNLGTFIGAVGFFIGAALLPVESAAESTQASL